MTDDEFNEHLKIVSDGKLTYGGLLVLGKNLEINKHFSDFRVDYLEIPATNYADAEPRFTYRIEEQENLWEYYFVLFQRLRVYANAPYTIGEMGIGHEDTKEIDALREALVNLLIHSDYFSPKKPRIRVFTNRIEFENPGALPRPVEELIRTDETLPRNPVLAKFFRLAKLCESAGFGFNKMLQWKKQTGNEVIFESNVYKTTFTFMLDTTAIKLENKKSGMITDESSQDTTRNNGETTEKQQRNNIENVESGIKTDKKATKTDKKTDKKILSLMQENPFVTISQLSEIIGVSFSAINQQIIKLRKAGIIRRDGADKGGKWVIIEKSQ